MEFPCLVLEAVAAVVIGDKIIPVVHFFHSLGTTSADRILQMTLGKEWCKKHAHVCNNWHIGAPHLHHHRIQGILEDVSEAPCPCRPDYIELVADCY